MSPVLYDGRPIPEKNPTKPNNNGSLSAEELFVAVSMLAILVAVLVLITWKDF